MADDKKKSADKKDDVMADIGGIFGVSSGKKKKKKKKKAAEEEPEVVAASTEEDEVEAGDESSEVDEAEEVEEVETAADEDDLEEDEDDEVDPEELSKEELLARLKAAEAKLSDDDEDEAEEPVKAKPSAKKTSAKKETAKKTSAKKETSKKKDEKAPAAVAGIFSTEDDDTPIDQIEVDSPYLDEVDLGGYNKKTSPMTYALIGVIVLLVCGLGYLGLSGTEQGERLKALFQGNLREMELAKARQKEEDHRAKLEAGLNRFGILTITGMPKYASFTLNGQTYYGQTSSGNYNALRITEIGTRIGNLNLKEDFTVEVSSPGFETKKYMITENKWDKPKGGGDGAYLLTANLVPESVWHKAEFDARMGESDSEYYGTVTINSVPAGATVEFNNSVLMDKDGNELKTPVTFDKFYKKDDKGKLEEFEVRVNTLFDTGNKVLVKMDGQPTFVKEINRPNWKCERKDEAEIKKLPKDHSPVEECNYKVVINADLEGITAFNKRMEEEMKKVKEHNKRERLRVLGDMGDELPADDAKADGKQASAK